MNAITSNCQSGKGIKGEVVSAFSQLSEWEVDNLADARLGAGPLIPLVGCMNQCYDGYSFYQSYIVDQAVVMWHVGPEANLSFGLAYAWRRRSSAKV